MCSNSLRKALASGLKVGDKTYGVDILDRDTQSDPSRAGQLAKTLINSDKIDMMLAVSTPETINPVADACEAAGVPCLSTVMPWEAWYFGRGAKPGQPSPFKWTYHFGFGGGEFFKAYVSQWNLIETNKKVGVLYPNDADGNAIRENLAPALAKAGFTIIDPGPYEDGTTDYSAQIAKFKAEKCEIFNTFPDPARLRRLLAPGRAAGLHQDGQDRPDRQDRPLPLRRRRRSAISATISRAPPIGTRPSPTSRRSRASAATNSPTATRRPRARSGRSSSARRWRCSTPASPRSEGEQRSRRTRQPSPRRCPR